ncbi:hypothetical protein VUR80DRAFT_1016 [Thermomyces stellatus]
MGCSATSVGGGNQYQKVPAQIGRNVRLQVSNPQNDDKPAALPQFAQTPRGIRRPAKLLQRTERSRLAGPPHSRSFFVVTPTFGFGSDYCILYFGPTRATISDFYPSCPAPFNPLILRGEHCFRLNPGKKARDTLALREIRRPQYAGKTCRRAEPTRSSRLQLRSR